MLENLLTLPPLISNAEKAEMQENAYSILILYLVDNVANQWPRYCLLGLDKVGRVVPYKFVDESNSTQGEVLWIQNGLD